MPEPCHKGFSDNHIQTENNKEESMPDMNSSNADNVHRSDTMEQTPLNSVVKKRKRKNLFLHGKSFLDRTYPVIVNRDRKTCSDYRCTARNKIGIDNIPGAFRQSLYASKARILQLKTIGNPLRISAFSFVKEATMIK